MHAPRSGRPVSRRAALAAGAGGLAAALAGCLGGSDGPSSGPVAQAAVPDDPAAFDYAAMGSADAPEITYYGNWKCPYCAQFATGFMADLVTDYVRPGEVRLRYRAMAYTGNGRPFLGPDAPAAARAGLAVWNAEPASYWAYHHRVFANQPPEAREWATADRLVEFAGNAGVSATDAVRTAVREGRYQSLLEATTRDAFDAGVRGTPTLVVDGAPVSPFEQQQTRDAIESLVG